MNSYMAFDGSERFASGMADDIKPMIFKVVINGVRMFRPQRESRELQPMIATLHGVLQQRKPRPVTKWHAIKLARCIVLRQWATDNEKTLARSVLDKFNG